MRPLLSPSGAGRARRRVAPSATYTDGLQHFLERRRQRFVTGFGSHCDAISIEIDRIAQGGPRVSATKLRQLAYRLGAQAAVAGFDVMQARQIANTLPDTLAEDLGATHRAAGLAQIGAAASAPR